MVLPLILAMYYISGCVGYVLLNIVVFHRMEDYRTYFLYYNKEKVLLILKSLLWFIVLPFQLISRLIDHMIKCKNDEAEIKEKLAEAKQSRSDNNFWRKFEEVCAEINEYDILMNSPLYLEKLKELEDEFRIFANEHELANINTYE